MKPGRPSIAKAAAGPVLHIDQLKLRLPAGYQHRAAAIARETARQLSLMPLPTAANEKAPGRLDRLSVPTLRLQGGESNRVIANRIARGIHGQLQQAQAPRQGRWAGPLAEVTGRSSSQHGARSTGES